MGRINLDHWFVKDNNLSISLMKLYVDISIKNEDDSIKLKVIDRDRNELTFNFNTLGEAIFFTENYIVKCNNIEDVSLDYQTTFEQESKVSNNKITLTPDEVDQAIIDYFSKNREFPISVEEKLTIKNNQPDLVFYLIEDFSDKQTERKVKTRLTNVDIKRVLNDYINFYSYELIDFKYIGGIHKVGYYFDENTPHYDGIELSVKKKSKKLLLNNK